ncbi:P63C domain-containing protein [Allosphingosinicella flava]|uniref:P63C domain-containing protein n=1 Tax=Allosphingosinicella flava TaxID=2771430 RepID=A0A7T2GKK6_9SPHN|nr:P63C domain-containing protein [Sphingosinicella flava]QPQ55574.1 P63C domain-containing protein [Sphingosinicella flava]
MDEMRKEASAKGGKVRAQRLTKEQRSESARIAAMTRWAGEGKAQPVLAKYGAPDRPLRIGDIEIPCYVLGDGTRVLAQRGLQGGIGLSLGGGKSGARRIAELMTSLAEKGVDIRGLTARVNSPIRFIPPHGGNPADGYEATILPDICAVIIDAANQGKLGAQRRHLAERAAVLQHGFATVGILALVDEATGYQDYRQRDALAEILRKFVAKELQPWIPTFPVEFYRQIYRLNGWEFNEQSNARPGVIGHWTNNIVYRRLAPGVWEELNRQTPRSERGNLRHKLFQRLTDDIGHPKLREHLAAVVMLMKYSPDWRVFMERIDKEFPQWGSNYLLPYPDDYAPPGGDNSTLLLTSA